MFILTEALHKLDRNKASHAHRVLTAVDNLDDHRPRGLSETKVTSSRLGD